METSLTNLISKQPLLKKILWQRTAASIGCLGGGGKCPSEAPHFIYAPRTPYLCELQQDEIPEISESTNLTGHPNPWEKQYASRNPVGMYSTCLLYNAACISGKCSIPIYETKLGEPRPVFLEQPSMGSSGATDLEDLPPYSMPPRPKPKKWWEDWLMCKCWQKETEEEPCGAPISLTPDQVEGEVLRLKMIHQAPRFCHPLVERLGQRTSFSPKDIPGANANKSKCYAEDPPPPPKKIPFYKLLFHHEPKTEVVYPKSNPRAKVMTFQEVCKSINHSLMTPSRFECGMREPNLVFNPVPAPYFSQCPQPVPCPPFGQPTKKTETCATAAAKASPATGAPRQAQPAPTTQSPCGKCRTSVSPSFEKPSASLPPPVPILTGVQMVPGTPTGAPMVGLMTGHSGAFPSMVPCQPYPTQPPPPPPPPRMVCGGKTPLDDMPYPFYSECREPECPRAPEPCYEESTEKPCAFDRCKKRDFDSEVEEEPVDGMPQPFFSKCPPKELKKFQGVDDK